LRLTDQGHFPLGSWEDKVSTLDTENGVPQRSSMIRHRTICSLPAKP